jgi:hypothetical protein
MLIKIGLGETNIKSINDRHYDNFELYPLNNYENIPYNYLTTSLILPNHLHEYEKTNWHGHFHNLVKFNLVWMNSPICIQLNSIWFNPTKFN